jgi:hypothetical protein
MSFSGPASLSQECLQKQSQGLGKKKTQGQILLQKITLQYKVMRVELDNPSPAKKSVKKSHGSEEKAQTDRLGPSHIDLFYQ